jgi:predicted NAD/FAD-dependent oxidoreductase
LPKGLIFTVDNKKQNRGNLGQALTDVRYEPILPTLTLYLGCFNLNLDALLTTNEDLRITWKAHADNAPVMLGEVRLGDLKVEDKRRR